MPFTKKEDPSSGDHKQLVLFTGIVVFLAIVALVVSVFACQDPGLITVDRLARYDLGFQGAWVFTIKKCCEFAAIAAVFIALLAGIGLVGARQNNKQLTCVYNVGLIIFSIVMFGLGVHSLGRQSVMQPIIDRQVADFCKEPTFIRLTQQLDCANTAGPLAVAAGATPSLCGQACKNRVETLSHTGEGCALLEGLCNNFLYSEHPDNVIPAEFQNPYYSAGLAVVPDATRCERKCDHDLLCIGFRFDQSNCVIKSANQTRYVAPSWTSVDTFGAAGSTINIKDENAVLWSFQNYGYGVAWILIVLGVVLCIMWALTMRILYNQNINKPGKPNAHQVGLMLCCPCCGGDDYKEPLVEDGQDYAAE